MSRALLQVRVEPRELAALRRRARAAGQTVSAYTREHLQLERRVPSPVQQLVLAAVQRAGAGQLTDGEREAIGDLVRAIGAAREAQRRGQAIDEVLAAPAPASAVGAAIRRAS